MVEPVSSKTLIYDLEFQELNNWLISIGEPAYRANQIWSGIYQNLWNKPEQFTNLPTPLRNQLFERYLFSALTSSRLLQSNDGYTLKTLFTLSDNRAIEAVRMLYDDRRTICISTQAGCAMGCVFCATGQMGYKRNLSTGEIVEQVLYFARNLQQTGEKVTNVVLMGMGEPFHNYDASLKAIDRLNHPQGFNLGARRFTVSTVGLVPAIRRFADEKRQVNLAISLHAANDELRSSMLPINKKYPIRMLMEACRYYISQTNRRLSFEWALIDGVNDRLDDARQLGQLLKGLLCHVNVIPLNPTQSFTGKATTRERAEAFCAELAKEGITATIRIRRGIDIAAGCGQLASLD